MRLEGDKLVKILLENGMAIHMYADQETIEKLRSNPRFVHFKDDGNDNICVAIDAMAGFEVLDERKDIPKETEAEAVNAPVPELPEEAK